MEDETNSKNMTFFEISYHWFVLKKLELPSKRQYIDNFNVEVKATFLIRCF